jgi:hypothetical protein
MQKLKNTAMIRHSIKVPFETQKVFDFFINNEFSKYYASISSGHKYFILWNGKKWEIGLQARRQCLRFDAEW